MNFCGVICEFNPFHNGHEYLIKQAKHITNSEIICLMSGNFVQRGTPAIENKHNRAKHAIEAGANVVLELPTIFATSNAENFAFGAIKIFKALQIKQIAFGIEDTNLETLQKVARLKFENSENFVSAFKNEIENGINYNTALKRSIAKTIKDENIIDVLNKPNNILAIEYLTAILKLDAHITPIAIPRCDNGYNSLTPEDKFASASAIRELINNNQPISKYVPQYAIPKHTLTSNEKSIYNSLLIHTLRQSPATDLEKCYDYSEGIEYRVKEKSNKFSNIEAITKAISTPRYRIPRVNKLLLYPLLNITKQAMIIAQKTKPAVKVLAINKNNKKLLKLVNKSKISLLVKNKDYDNLSKNQKIITDIDDNASNIYALIQGQEHNSHKKIGTMFL